MSRQSIKTGLSWHPTKNALAWTDTMGQLCRWSEVVGAKYPSPCEFVEYLPASQLKQKMQREEIDDLFGDTVPDEDQDIVIQDVPRHHTKAISRRDGRSASSWNVTTKAQVTFQPTSTPMRAGRRYMCLNMIGSLMAIEQDSQQSISFESHDSNARRNWRFVDHFGYDMAAIGSTGAFFACPSREGKEGNESEEEEEEEGDVEGDKVSRRKGHPSSVYFKPFEALGAWTTSGSEWSLHLARGENAVAVAIGGIKSKGDHGVIDNITAVVATSHGYLRFFSASGMQKYIWALGSQVVSMAAGNRFLLVVHRGNIGAALERYQNLSYTVIELSSLTVKQEGTLPLAADTTLTWLGFNDMDYPAIYDSRQVLYILDRCLGPAGQARWTPILDANVSSTSIPSPRIKYWPVGLDSSNLMTIFLKGNSLAYPDPSASSRPLIQEVELKMPLLNLETPMGALEEQYLKNIQLSCLIRAYQASLNEQQDKDSNEILSNLAKPSALDHDADKALLQIVQLSCKSDKHQRVLDAVKELHGTRTLDAALQIGAFFHLSSLVDRMTGLRNWVASRRERDEQLAWSGVASFQGLLEEQIGGVNSRSRVFVGNSQSPSIHENEKASLSKDFAERNTRSYGQGGRSDLAKLGASPASTYMSIEAESKLSDKENDGERTRGHKRQAGDNEMSEDNISEGEKRKKCESCL